MRGLFKTGVMSTGFLEGIIGAYPRLQPAAQWEVNPLLIVLLAAALTLVCCVQF